jgi:hypothetical protein
MGRLRKYGFTRHPPGAYVPSFRRATVRYTLVISLLSGSVGAVGAEDGWKNLGNGTLSDTRTKQEWLQEDNGEDIDWSSARSYCEGKHRGWRLPRLPELKSIYDEHAPGIRCARATCRVSSQFHLSGTWFWSATQVGKDSTDGIELAWGVLMTNGAQTQAVRDASYGSRVLCVRDP